MIYNVSYQDVHEWQQTGIISFIANSSLTQIMSTTQPQTHSALNRTPPIIFKDKVRFGGICYSQCQVSHDSGKPHKVGALSIE